MNYPEDFAGFTDDWFEVSYPTGRGRCDLVLTGIDFKPEFGLAPYEWAIENKYVRFSGDNGKNNDYGVTKVVSPYRKDRSGVLDDWISGPSGSSTSIWEVGQQPSTVSSLESGKRYFFGIDSGTNDNNFGAHCGPNWIEQRGITANFMINMPDGGVTTQILKVTDLTIGASVT